MSRSRISAPAQPPQCSRCFRTDAEGYIPLRPDWPGIFNSLQGLSKVALQTRHSYARLIHLGPVPEIVWDEAGAIGRDEAGALHLHTDLWGAARGRLSICPCCDSPGYLDILNARGGEILQFCADVNTAPAEWAACLEELVEFQPVAPVEARQSGFPLVPSGLYPLRESVDVLTPLLAALGHEQVPVRFLLRTPEVVHLRQFTLRRVGVDYPLLTASDGRTTLQLALPPVQRVMVASDLSLHLVGPGDTLLLSVGCPGEHAMSWQAALASGFPSLRPFLSPL